MSKRRRPKGFEYAEEPEALPPDARFPRGAIVLKPSTFGRACAMDAMECYGLPPMPQTGEPVVLPTYDGGVE